MRSHVVLGLLLVLPANAALAEARATGVTPAQARLRSIKLRQERRLQQLLSLPGVDQRSERLWQLCQLQAEIAILCDAVEASHWRRRAITSCRRMVAVAPSSRRAEPLLTLSRLELAVGRAHRSGELAREVVAHPEASRYHRCEAMLLLTDLKRRRCVAVDGACHRAVVTGYREVLHSKHCMGAASLSLRRQGRYQLGWALVRARQPLVGARVLGRLLKDRAHTVFERRVLRDLALIWASHGVSAGALEMLAKGGGKLGTELVVLVGKGLLRQAKDSSGGSTSQVAKRALFEWLASARGRGLFGRSRLNALRWQALGELSAPAALLSAARQCAAHERKLAALALKNAAALARRKAQRELELRVARLVAQRFSDVDGTEWAHHALARDALARSDYRLALLSLTRLLARCAKAPCAQSQVADARIDLLFCLQRMGQSGQPLIAAAMAFLQGHPRDERRHEVRLVLAGALNGQRGYERALGLARRVMAQSAPLREHARRVALTAARGLGRWRDQYELTARGSHDERSLAALAGARALMVRDPAEALRWAEIAAGHARSSARASQVLMFGAALALRQGKIARAVRLFERLGLQAGAGQRSRYLRLQAQWLEGAGALEEARRARQRLVATPQSYPRRAAAEVSLAKLLLWMNRPTEAAPIVRRLRRDLMAVKLPTALEGRLIVELGPLLRATSMNPYGFFLQRANGLWRRRPLLAADCLLRAAQLAPQAKRRAGLARQALDLTRRLSRRGKPIVAALRLRVTAARLLRQAMGESSSGALRMERLLENNQKLVPVLAQRHPRWSAAAGLEIADTLGAIAKILAKSGAHAQAGESRRRQRQLLYSIAALARRRGGLTRFSLTARRRLGRAAAVGAPRGRLPEVVPREALVAAQMMRNGSPDASRQLATRGLELYGPKGSLFCVRGVALLALGEVARAVTDFRHATVLPGSRACAHGNLALLAGAAGRTRKARKHQRAAAGASPVERARRSSFLVGPALARAQQDVPAPRSHGSAGDLQQEAEPRPTATMVSVPGSGGGT